MNIWTTLDYFFIIFHGVVILINVFGWIPVRTRKVQRVVLVATLLSWFVLGAFYGWGYCFLTDWHWDVLTELGTRPTQSVYVQYLLHRLFGVNISAALSNGLTIGGLFFGILGALFVCFWKGKKEV